MADKNGGNERRDVNPAYPEDEDDESTRKTRRLNRRNTDKINKYCNSGVCYNYGTVQKPPTPLPKEFYEELECNSPGIFGYWSSRTPTSAKEYDKWKEIGSPTKNSKVFESKKDGDCCAKSNHCGAGSHHASTSAQGSNYSGASAKKVIALPKNSKGFESKKDGD